MTGQRMYTQHWFCNVKHRHGDGCGLDHVHGDEEIDAAVDEDGTIDLEVPVVVRVVQEGTSRDLQIVEIVRNVDGCPLSEVPAHV